MIPSCQGAICTYNTLKNGRKSTDRGATIECMKKKSPRSPRDPERTRRHKDRSGRRDIDMKLFCRRCGQQGLRYGSKTQLCETCYLDRPAIMKAAGTADIRVVMQRHTRAVVDRFGFDRALGMLKIPPSSIDAALSGNVWIGPEGKRPGSADAEGQDTSSIAGAEIDPHIAWLMMRQHRQFAVLDAATTALVRHWRPVVRRFLAQEQPHHRARRQTDARHRVELSRYVPRADASLDPQVAGNAYGRVSDRRGTSRAPFPFRIALQAWSIGLGAGRISRLALMGGCPAGTSTISRMLIQARRPFAGAEKVSCEVLAAELMSRPLAREA